MEDMVALRTSLFNYADGFWLEEAREVVEIGVLVKLVEDGARPVFDIGGSANCECTVGEL